MIILLYKNGVQKKILTSDGMLMNTGTSSSPVYSRQYFLKDHLGNVRVVFDENGIVKQVSNYYPYGMEYGESAEDQTEMTYQDYQFGGKEFERDFELNMYDFGARNYDATMGRWTTMDPLAEKFPWQSPYVYCSNNPVGRIDPTGMADKSSSKDDKENEYEKQCEAMAARFDLKTGEITGNHTNIIPFRPNITTTGNTTKKKSKEKAVKKAEGQGDYSIDNAVNALNENGYSSYAAAKAAGDGARCARFIRWSLEAGFGLQRDALKGIAPVPARQYGPFLEGLGFTQVNVTDYFKGDIAVIQGYPGGTADINGVPYGHVQMYNGSQWISNFHQNNIWPGSLYQKYQPELKIYRINP